MNTARHSAYELRKLGLFKYGVYLHGMYEYSITTCRPYTVLMLLNDAYNAGRFDECIFNQQEQAQV